MNKVSVHALTGFVLYKQNVLLCESRQLVHDIKWQLQSIASYSNQNDGPIKALQRLKQCLRLVNEK